uniref:Uncharacterized protein n=1 Tax=Theileria annulata TaxID=5874 RepID=A0A3B0NFR1_THEAN
MESCIEGLGKFGLLLEESVQVELLLEFKRLVNEFIDKDVKNYSLIIAGINAIIKIVKLMTNFEYNWVYEVFTKLSTRIVPLLFQGELAFNKQAENVLDDGDDSNSVMKEEYSVYYSWPCVTIKFLKCLENITNLLLKSNIISDFQIISQLVQVLVSISLLVDSDVAVPLMYYVNDIISKTPKLQAILSREGIVFSVLTKGKSSYWDLKLLKSHYSPYISSLFNQSKDPNTIVLKPKQTHTPMDLKGIDVSKFYNQSGLEIMNFIKGIVDGILATDIDSNTGKSKYSYDPGGAQDDSDSHSLSDIFQNRITSNDNVFLNTSISNLSELYKIERENCIKGLVLRYGEGCLQHLSQLLKSNHETILTLSSQIQTYLSALNDVNNRMESAAVEHLRLKNENINLAQGIQTLESENSSLKSQLEQAKLNIKSTEKQISMLNGTFDNYTHNPIKYNQYIFLELLKENKNTFDNMKNRCEEFYTLKSEIESLNKKLTFSENHIAMLNKERDEFWSDPNRKLTDNDYKNRIMEAFQRQDRAMTVAKLMASQKSQLSPETANINKENYPEPTRDVDLKELSDLRLRVDYLEDENSHLKEINDSLHTMCADISRNLKDVKTTYLKESVDSLRTFLPTKTTPIQLVFVQPTGVLDLTLDQEYLNKLSQPEDSTTRQQYQHLDQSQTSQGTQYFTPKDSLGLNIEQLESEQPRPKPKKKLNLRSKVINYVTNLDVSSSDSDENNSQLLLRKDEFHEPQFDTNKPIEPRELIEPKPMVERCADKSEKFNSWNSDWDFFEDDQSASNKENITCVDNASEPKDGSLKFNSALDENSSSDPTFSTKTNPSDETGYATGVPSEQANYHTEFTPDSPSVTSKLVDRILLKDTFPDDIFDSIINEQENSSEQKVETSKNKGWDDLDFDTSNS